MNARALAALILLNVVLLAAVIVVAFTPRSAQAQFGGGGAQYLMVSGQATGLPQDAIYLVNITSGQVAVISYNSGTDTLMPIARRDLARDLNAAAGGGR